MAESQPPPPPAGSQSVQLGMGTLIIIALIVSMCSGSSEVKNLRSENAELRQQVGEINRKLDTLLQKQAPAPDPAQSPGQ
jgi:hypothetical protein